MEGEGENSINFCIIGKWYKLNLIVLFFFFAFLFFFWLSFYNLISASSPFSNDGWNMLLLQQPSTELTKKLLNKQDIYKAGNTTYHTNKRSGQYDTNFTKKATKKGRTKLSQTRKARKKIILAPTRLIYLIFFARKMWTWKTTKAITIYTLMWRRTKSDERCPIFSIKTGTWTSTFELVSSFLFNVANQIK